MLAMLFFVTAALGIPFLWMSRGFSTLAKVVLTIVVLAWTALILWAFWLVMVWSWTRIADRCRDRAVRGGTLKLPLSAASSHAPRDLLLPDWPADSRTGAAGGRRGLCPVDRLRERGLATVLGGLHATACPEEADAVVAGSGAAGPGVCHSGRTAAPAADATRVNLWLLGDSSAIEPHRPGKPSFAGSRNGSISRRASRPTRGSRGPCGPPPRRSGHGALILPQTQPAGQQLRSRVTRDLRSGGSGGAGGDVGPRAGRLPALLGPAAASGLPHAQMPDITQVQEHLDVLVKPWVRAVYVEKFGNWLRGEDDYMNALMGVSPEQSAQRLDLIERMPERTQLVRDHQDSLQHMVDEYSNVPAELQERIRKLLAEAGGPHGAPASNVTLAPTSSDGERRRPVRKRHPALLSRLALTRKQQFAGFWIDDVVGIRENQ